MRDALELSGAVIFVFAILFGLFAGVVSVVEKNYCSSMESLQPDFEFHWDFWAGCLVQTPSGYWVNASEYQYIEGDIR